MKFSILVLLLFFSNFVILPTNKTKAIGPFYSFDVMCRIGIEADYMNMIKQNLHQIGIELNIFACDSLTILSHLLTYDFDILSFSLFGSGIDPVDFDSIYSENGMNFPDYSQEMDWNSTLETNEEIGWGTNEWYLNNGSKIIPPYSEIRIQHYWDWEQYLMDELLPCFPLLTAKGCVAFWSNLKGYNYSKGITQSWGNMYFDGYHSNQIDNSELVISDYQWSNLNPLTSDIGANSIIDAIFDPLIWYDSDIPYPHLAKSITFQNETTVRIECREGIKWQEDPDGLFPDEYFDAKDVYFTFYMLKNVIEDTKYQWIKEMNIVDNMTLDIYIDYDPATTKNDYNPKFYHYLETKILPEHYLNQTQLGDGRTPDISHTSYDTFSINPFGTGLFEFSNYVENLETQLNIWDDCWYLNETITSDLDLKWNERFGFLDDFTPLQKLIIRIVDDYNLMVSDFKQGKSDIEIVTNDYLADEEYLTDSKYNHQIYSSGMNYYLFFNLGNDLCQLGDFNPSNNEDISVGLAIRKAICYTINRTEINVTDKAIIFANVTSFSFLLLNSIKS
ncbi:MAG: ABC transporter substrate-binding protein [Candidatus Thorarchaeota archaeon]